MRILIVEDDAHIADVLRRCLTDRHYAVDIATNGIEGEEMALVNDYDLIILDVMLPGRSGIEVCRSLRQAGMRTPIMLLTALGQGEDIVRGLDEGADKYLTKPFDIDILLAHVRSLLRRGSDVPATAIQVGDLRIDTAARRAYRGDVGIDLTAKEFALLEYFAMNEGRVLTREMIGEHVWDMNFDPRSNVVDSLVRFVRRKVDSGFDTKLIHTIRGVGYRLEADSEP